MDLATALLYPAWYLSVAAQAAVVGRIVTSGLTSRYPALLAYLSLSIVKSAVLLLGSASWNAAAYERPWAVAELFVFAFYVLAAREAWVLTTERYPRLGALGKNALGVLVAAALLGSLLVTPADFGAAAHWPAHVGQMFVLRRFALFAVALFLLLAWIASDLILPIESRQNFTIHRRLLTWNATVLAAHQMALNVFGRSAGVPAGLAMLLACSAGWLAWAWAIRPAGEAEPYTPTEEEGWAALRRMREAAASIRRMRSTAR